MRVKLDEDLSEELLGDLSCAGHDAATVVTQGWTGTKDVDLWPRVVAEKIYWITADKGFGDIRKYRPGTHPGILLLRPDNESIASFRELIHDVLSLHPLETLVGALTVASPRSIRIRGK
jgi:predicted nuclease of predicted toxin-antitoxin system